MASCTIERVRIEWGKIPVGLTFSFGSMSEFSFTITRLTAGDAEGVGETLCPPLDFTMSFTPTLLGKDARCLDSLFPDDDSQEAKVVCDGISIALHDLVGRISGLPVRTLLGGSSVDRVPLMPCIFPHNSDEAAEQANWFFSQGYKYLKTKLIGKLEEDKARIHAIRSVSPKGAILQGDANEGYKTIPEARTAIECLGAAGLDIFEDPLKGGPEEYARICGTDGAKVMIDELSRRTDNLLAVLRAGACDVVGIHPVQPGGLCRALEHARLAQSFGVPVVIGGTGYAAVGSAAYQQLTAVATPEGPCGELGGFFDHYMPKSLVRAPFRMENGAALLPDTPGLGVEIDEDVLKEFVVGSREWTIS